MSTTNKNVYRGALDLKVKIIDWTPINKAISEKIGQEVECRLGKGFIDNVEAIFDEDTKEVEIKPLIIDNECCGTTTETKNYYFSEVNDGTPFCVNTIEGIGFYKVDTETENGKRISMFPSYYFSIDIDDVINCLTGEEKSLFEFMDKRYQYNPRICENELEILKLVYYNDRLNSNTEFLKKEIVEVEI